LDNSSPTGEEGIRPALKSSLMESSFFSAYAYPSLNFLPKLSGGRRKMVSTNPLHGDNLNADWY
jgi:hypothetical protein